MFEISIPRIRRYAAILGVVGTVAVFLEWGWAIALGFAVGAIIAQTTVSSWARMAGSLNPEATARPSAKFAIGFLALRYALIGAAIYGTIKVLGVTPIALLAGLMVAFGGVLVELVQQASKR